MINFTLILLEKERLAYQISWYCSKVPSPLRLRYYSILRAHIGKWVDGFQRRGTNCRQWRFLRVYGWRFEVIRWQDLIKPKTSNSRVINIRLNNFKQFPIRVFHFQSRWRIINQWTLNNLIGLRNSIKNIGIIDLIDKLTKR